MKIPVDIIRKVMLYYMDLGGDFIRESGLKPGYDLIVRKIQQKRENVK